MDPLHSFVQFLPASSHDAARLRASTTAEGALRLTSFLLVSTYALERIHVFGELSGEQYSFWNAHYFL
jgi:hypothetical protein